MQTIPKPVRAAAIPKTGRAAAIDRFGGPEVLSLHTLPVPDLDGNEVLIRLDTAGVGVWDADMRAGWWPDGEPRFPLVLGTDGAGTVAAIGARIRRLRVGDQVYSYSFTNPKGGFYAEYVAVAAEKVAPIPRGLDLQLAGAIPTTGLTALQGIDDALHVKKGEAVVIHAASGGVGTLAVQFAKLRGARVLATASGNDGVDLVRRLGADAAIDGRHEDITAAARRLAPGGIDAVLALAGGEALEHCLAAVRTGGRCADLDCGRLQLGDGACSECGGNQSAVPDILDEAVHEAVEQNAQVRPWKDAALSKADSIAALKRF